MNPKKMHFLTFWAINGQLDIKRLKKQLEEMKSYGFDGTIFHPRYYPGSPVYMGEEYMSILSETILYAKELGIEFWIYDENGWPSGSGNGMVAEHFPDRLCQWMVYKNEQVILESRRSFNTLDREQMQYFIKSIYDGYRLGLEQEAFSYVTGFFSDEVGFLDGHGAVKEKGIPWCEEALERVEEKLGKKFEPELLFKEKEGYKAQRACYWQALADILSESFYGAVNEWCEKYGKRYTAHLKGEENLFFQIPYSGTCFSNLKKVNTPAVDALERYPGNHYYPRIASSLSRQFGDGECMAECLGGSGWGLSPENLEDYINWLAESGINRYAFHLWQYEKNSESIRDWPPNIPWGMTWKEIMPELLMRLRKRWNPVFEKQKHKYLLVAPVRGCMSEYRAEDAQNVNEHNGAGTPKTASGKISQEFGQFVEKMYASGMAYDVTQESILEEYGVLKDGKFYLGKAAYDCVIAGKGCVWNKTEFIRSTQFYHAEMFEWKSTGIEKKNRIPLEWKEQHACIIGKQLEKVLPNSNILLHDKVKEVVINGHKIEGIKEERGYVYPLTEACRADTQMDIYIHLCKNGEQHPLAFLEGSFLVKNRHPYKKKDSRQLLVEDGFYLEPMELPVNLNTGNFIEAGLPFYSGGVYVKAKHFVDENGMLEFGNIQAECAWVKVEGEEIGYVWGPDWKIKTGLETGIYEVELKLIPSTFNTYGPHHYIDGDSHLISPAQYAGEKNFADRKEAPEYTKIEDWNFVKFGIDEKKGFI